MHRSILLAALCCASLSAQAQLMPDHLRIPDRATYMQTCMRDMADSLGGTEEDLRQDDVSIAKTALLCQCEIEHLPKAGDIVDRTRFDAVVAACSEEVVEKDWDAFAKRYSPGANRTFEAVKRNRAGRDR